MWIASSRDCNVDNALNEFHLATSLHRHGLQNFYRRGRLISADDLQEAKGSLKVPNNGLSGIEGRQVTGAAAAVHAFPWLLALQVALRLGALLRSFAIPCTHRGLANL